MAFGKFRQGLFGNLFGARHGHTARRHGPQGRGPVPALQERPLPEVRIHVPDETLGRDDDEEEEEEATAAEGEEAPAADDGAPAAPKKRTRRGSRGGKGRKRKPATTAAETNGGEPAAEAGPLPEPEPEPEPEPVAENGDFSQPDYVPMSEWIDDFERRGR